MKIKRFTILVVTIVALSLCNKESDRPYSNLDIVLDNAQAAMYFHTIFCEAENAWAIVDSEEYLSFDDLIQINASSYKIITYDEDENSVTIEYQSWTSYNNLNLDGTIIVEFDTCSYRKSRETARVFLEDFFVEGQNIAGRASLQYKNVEEGENDQYTFNILDGTAIREKDGNAVLLTALINGGNYERIAGGETLSHDDDVWKYWGTMSGMLREKPNMKYTNTVVQTVNIDGVSYDSAIYYELDCKTARHEYEYPVYSEIKIPGRDDIKYVYLCSQVLFLYETHKIRN